MGVNLRGVNLSHFSMQLWSKVDYGEIGFMPVVMDICDGL
jgi:hypothetical protein